MSKSFGQLHTHNLIVGPRLSEKAVALNQKGQFVFTVNPKASKLSVKSQLESLYGIEIQSINMVKMAGKTKRSGRSVGTTKSYKKAIVTLKPGSKRPEIIEVS